MRVHHLNCGTMAPFGRRLINGNGSPVAPAHLVCHCLLLESDDDGLILVDTGIGTRSLADPVGDLGRTFLTAVRPRLDAAETAVARIRALGFEPEDVRHVVLTHLDLDHAGGLPDFPHATVHLHASEHIAGLARVTRKERERYRSAHWAHGPRWHTYNTDGDTWRGIPGVQPLQAMAASLALVPLPGHTRGHSGVLVELPGGPLLHAGDAVFADSTIDPVHPSTPVGLRVFERVMATRNGDRLESLGRLARLRREHPDVAVVSAHDPVGLARAQAG